MSALDQFLSPPPPSTGAPLKGQETVEYGVCVRGAVLGGHLDIETIGPWPQEFVP